MEEELGLVGATADDTEAELIRSICETELLDGKCGCHRGAPACERTGTVGNRSRRRKAVSVQRKHSFVVFFFVWCQFLCKLSVSLLYPSGGGFSMVKVSQSVSIVCRSCGVKGVILLKRDAQTVLSYLLSLSPLQGSICCLPLFHWCSRSATTLGSTAMRGSRLLQP